MKKSRNKKPARACNRKAEPLGGDIVAPPAPALPEPDKSKESVVQCPLPPEMDKSEPLLKHLGGSIHDDWNQVLCNQVLNAAKYFGKPTPVEKAKQSFSHLAFLTGVNPQDVIEGMMAAQLFASHAAAMECYRRAMLPDQSLEGRQINLTHAAKLTRANAAQVEALAKHRNKGQQKVTVEHVHVYQGGQAIVGHITPRGGDNNSEVQPHAVGYASSPEVRREIPEREVLPVPGHGERPLPDARRPFARRPQGQSERL